MARLSEGELQAQWTRDRAELLMQMPFLGTLAMQLDLVVGRWKSIPTAATDGHCIFGNARFLRRLEAPERVFVLAHEVWHCAAMHIPRRAGRDAERWNVAIDHETNAILKDAGLEVPEAAILLRDYWYRRVSAETIYERLPKHPPKRRRYVDVHAPQGPDWPGASEEAQSQRENVRVWSQRLRTALQMSGQRPGDLPQGMARVVDSLLTPSRAPWQRVLRRHVGRHLSPETAWTRPNRRHLARGQWLPGRARDLPRLAIAVDTSGSTRALLPMFLRELRAIAAAMTGHQGVRLLEFDAAVHTDRTVEAGSLRTGRRTLHGGGGTDFTTVFAHLRADPPDVLIVLTDGRGPRGSQAPGYPVIWAIPDATAETVNIHDGWATLPAPERFPRRRGPSRRATRQP